MKKIFSACLMLLSVFVFTACSCSKKPNVLPENFIAIGEKVSVHSEYLVKINSIDIKEFIYVRNGKNDTEDNLIYASKDKHFIEVNLTLTSQQVSKVRELKESFFKLKDHTGVKVKLGIEIYFRSVQDSILYTNEFNTITPYTDYNWVGKKIENNQEENISLYYEISKDLSPYETYMVIEVDFIYFGWGDNAGIDIVLAKRTEAI